MRLIRVQWVRVVLAVLAAAGLQLAGARAALGLGCATATTSTIVPGAVAPSVASAQSPASGAAVHAAHTDTPAGDVGSVAVPGLCAAGASLPAAIVRGPGSPIPASAMVSTTAGALTSFIPAPPFHPPRSI